MKSYEEKAKVIDQKIWNTPEECEAIGYIAIKLG